MPRAPRGGAPWTFGTEIALGDMPGAGAALRWMFKRNCSIAPSQLARVYLSLCLVSLTLAGVFYWQGATLVMAFVGLEMALLGAALWVFARHTDDHETLTLVGRFLHVEQRSGRQVERADFALARFLPTVLQPQ